MPSTQCESPQYAVILVSQNFLHMRDDTHFLCTSNGSDIQQSLTPECIPPTESSCYIEDNRSFLISEDITTAKVFFFTEPMPVLMLD